MDDYDLVIEVRGGCVTDVWEIGEIMKYKPRVYVRDFDNMEVGDEDNPTEDELGGIILFEEPRATCIW